jgi:hypothetical protein
MMAASLRRSESVDELRPIKWRAEPPAEEKVDRCPEPGEGRGHELTRLTFEIAGLRDKVLELTSAVSAAEAERDASIAAERAASVRSIIRAVVLVSGLWFAAWTYYQTSQRVAR